MIDAQIYAAIIGALIGTPIGIYIKYLFDSKKSAKDRRDNYIFERKYKEDSLQIEARLRHLERQIEEFYGPIWGLMQRSRNVYKILEQRRKEYEPNLVAEDYLKDQFFLPINEKIYDLIQKKSYLIDSIDLPETFQEFMRHKTSIEVLYGLWRDKGIESSKIKGVGYPKEFDEDVEKSLKRLKEDYQNYLMISEKIEINQLNF